MISPLFIGYILYHLGLLKGTCLVLWIIWVVLNIFTSGYQLAQKIEEMR